MKTRGRKLVIMACVVTAAFFSACFLDAVRNNPNDPKADNYKGEKETPKEWKEAKRVDIANTFTEYPSVGIDEEGNSIATWIQMDTFRQVYARKYIAGTGWGTDTSVVKISTSTLYSNVDSYYAKVAMMRNGEAAAVWYRDDGGSAYVEGNNTENGNWIGEANIGASVNSMWAGNAGVQIAAGNDSAIAVYYEFYTAMNQFNFNLCKDNTWGIDTPVGADSFTSEPALAMSPEGKAVAIFKREDAGALDVKGFIFDGSGWGSAESIEPNSATVTYVYMGGAAMSDSGRALAAWSTIETASMRYLKARFHDGSAWGEVMNITTSNSDDLMNVQAAIDPDGTRACVIWTLFSNKIFVSIYGYGTNTWSDPVRIDQLDTAVSSPRVKIDKYGNIIVVWSQDSSMEGYHVWACRYTLDEGWSDPKQLDSLSYSVNMGPEIAVNTNGYATVVWTQSAGAANDQTWAARYEDIEK